MLALTTDPAAAERVETVIEGLDMTIREIRSTIFELGSSGIDSGLRAEVMKVAEEASQALGFRPTVRFVGPVDSGVSDDVATHLLAVVREALSNVARHAQSPSAEVEVWVGDGVVRVVVEDRGIGYRPGDRISGVANMRGRADQLGGTFEIGPARSGSAGTRLHWQAPLSA
jgi:signal transduction histidine kinase